MLKRIFKGCNKLIQWCKKAYLNWEWLFKFTCSWCLAWCVTLPPLWLTSDFPLAWIDLDWLTPAAARASSHHFFSSSHYRIALRTDRPCLLHLLLLYCSVFLFPIWPSQHVSIARFSREWGVLVGRSTIYSWSCGGMKLRWKLFIPRSAVLIRNVNNRAAFATDVAYLPVLSTFLSCWKVIWPTFNKPSVS